MPHQDRRRTAVRKKSRRSGLRPAIEPSALYPYVDAAIVACVAPITLRRATDAGYLRVRRIGRKTVFLGSDLMAWVESGGKTGRSSADLEREAAA